MKDTKKNTSSEKENKKVQSGKQVKSNRIREDENNSINEKRGEKPEYPYETDADKQYKVQSEFIDRNSNSKNKS